MVDLAAILVREGILTPGTVAKALGAAHNGDIASGALQLGLATEAALVRALAQAHGCPGVDLSKSVVPTANLAALSAEWCRPRGVLPVTVGRGEVVLAMGNPENLAVADEARFITGRKVLRYVAITGAIERILDALNRLRREGAPAYRGPGAPALLDPLQPWVGVVHATDKAVPVELPRVQEIELELVGVAESLFETPFAAPTPTKPKPKQPDGTAQKAPLPMDVPTLRVDGAGAGKVVLVADENAEARAVVVAAASKLGCTVLQASDGNSALDIAREARPDVAVLEAMMPAKHGFEVCRAIKGDPELRKTQVVLTSRVYRGAAAADARAAFGADAFLEKPLQPEQFARVLKIALIGAAAPSHSGDEAHRTAAEKAWRAGASALSAGKTDEALTLCRQAVAEDAFSAEAHYYLGHVLSKEGLLFEAAGAYERSAELRPDVDAAYQYLAQTYEKLGFQKSAREAWARAIETCRDATRKQAMQARLAKLLSV